MTASDTGIERLEATVHGRVQGVGFRFFVIRLADELELAGWVANEPDGSVRLVAEGPGSALDQLHRTISIGPRGAVVDRVDARRLPATGSYAAFEVRAGGHRGD
jgi:acylphosphatase